MNYVIGEVANYRLQIVFDWMVAGHYGAMLLNADR